MAKNVLNYLEKTTVQHPNANAVIDEHGCYTYEQLFDDSRRIGSALAERHIFKQGVIVCMEKSYAALVTQLGTLYAGAYYVPVFPEIPEERLLGICSVLNNPIVIADDSSLDRICEFSFDIDVIPFSSIANHPINQEVLRDIRLAIDECDPVYTLFTSGSTGIPKGVIISHRAVVSFIDSFTDTFGINNNDVIANQAPFDFDVSTKDIYSSLATGAVLVIIPRRLFSQPAELVSFLERNHVTVLIWAVAALCIISTYHALTLADLSSIRKVMFSGEIMPMKHLKAWREHLPYATFVNLYGPTEITCNCLYHVLEPTCDYEDGIPLGTSFSHCEVFLVDSQGQEVLKPNVEGEIFVKGPSLSSGYLGQPELTSHAFKQNPLHSTFAEPVYRTGDIAVFDEHGQLFFCGRKDNQVKYQGHRIELEELDLIFEKLPGVDRCRCAFDEQHKRIYAFYEGKADEASLPKLTRSVLPVFMRPSIIRKVPYMPLNKNGKVDRKSLLASFGTKRKKQECA